MAATFVQGATPTGSAGSPIVIAYGSNVVAGNTLIVFMTHSYLGCPPTVVDTQLNTWTSKGSQPNPGNSRYFYIFTAVAGSSGANTVTITFACGTSRMCGILEYSGLEADPYNVQNVKLNTANPCDTGSITTTTDNELVLSMFTGVTTPTYSGGSGTTRLTNDINDVIRDEIKASAGAVAPDATASAVSVPYSVQGFVASFKATASAAVAAPVVKLLQLLGVGT